MTRYFFQFILVFLFFYRVIKFERATFKQKIEIMAEQTFIIHTVTAEQESALKAFIKAMKMNFEVAEKPFKPEFIAKIEKSKKQAQVGKVTRVQKENLKELLGL